MTFNSEGTATSAWPLLVISRKDRSPRVSSVSGVQPFFGSAQAIAGEHLRCPRIGRTADCANAPVQTESPFPEPVRPREKSAPSSSACSHRQAFHCCRGYSRDLDGRRV